MESWNNHCNVVSLARRDSLLENFQSRNSIYTLVASLPEGAVLAYGQSWMAFQYRVGLVV